MLPRSVAGSGEHLGGAARFQVLGDLGPCCRNDPTFAIRNKDPAREQVPPKGLERGRRSHLGGVERTEELRHVVSVLVNQSKQPCIWDEEARRKHVGLLFNAERGEIE